MRNCLFATLCLILALFSVATAQDIDLSYDQVKSDVEYIKSKTSKILDKSKECHKLYDELRDSGKTQDEVSANHVKVFKCIQQDEWMRLDLASPAIRVYTARHNQNLVMEKFGYTEKQYAETKEWWDSLLDCFRKIKESDKKAPSTYSFVQKPKDEL